jgi:hypothetical protein
VVIKEQRVSRNGHAQVICAHCGCLRYENTISFHVVSKHYSLPKSTRYRILSGGERV